MCFILRPSLTLGTQGQECFDTRCNPLSGSQTLQLGAGSACGDNVLEYSLPNPQICPRTTRTLTTDPNAGEILSPHLPPPVNMKMLSLKGWKKLPTRGPRRMRAGRLAWERSPATSTLLNHWEESPLLTTRHFSHTWKNNGLGTFLFRRETLNFRMPFGPFPFGHHHRFILLSGHSPSFSPYQPHWPSLCSSNEPSPSLPQDCLACCSLF